MPLSHFVPLFKLSLPTLIYPAILPKPPTPFIPYGFKIPAQNLESPHNPKAIVIFIGGFCDTIMCAVFKNFIIFNEESCLKIYASFNSKTLFSAWLPLLAKSHLPLFVIAHSWGANNFYKALNNLNQNAHQVALHYLLTLDPVGICVPKTRPPHIKLWENVYIAAKHTHLRRPNIAALIGGAWNALDVSDYNIALQKPNHHASINQMIESTQFYSTLTRIIRV
ncbi:MAG: hypothetical protein J1E28_01270 [Helicobacter sp.]|uniref:hypothetical protein n=1 Tax=Helicobacter sp. TaxID=218 RepID=UPI0025C517C3|nr:hypothetical protein [Helicobacter sp.]MCH5313017.1 hypothetical protein [Helicobacter sp.]